MELHSIQQACSSCAVGQLHVTATSNTSNKRGENFTMLQCKVCEAVYKYQEGIMSLVKIGNLYRIPQVAKAG